MAEREGGSKLAGRVEDAEVTNDLLRRAKLIGRVSGEGSHRLRKNREESGRRSFTGVKSGAHFFLCTCGCGRVVEVLQSETGYGEVAGEFQHTDTGEGQGEDTRDERGSEAEIAGGGEEVNREVWEGGIRLGEGMRMPELKVLVGDALEKLGGLPDESVQSCVTSPPYWGLRDYGTAEWEGGDTLCDHKKPPGGGHGEKSLIGKGERDIEIMSSQQYFSDCRKCGAKRIDSQLGLEKTPEEYVSKMVEIFSEVRRVLRKDGTLWLNLGDSYTSGGRGGGMAGEAGAKQRSNAGALLGSKTPPPGLKSKDIVGIPWRVAFALQADGWYLRQDIIWAKPNPMPESVTDRCTKAHEYIFLLTKSVRYFYDAEAIKEQNICTDPREVQSGLVRSRMFGYETKENELRTGSRKNDGTGYGGDGSKIRDHVGNSLNAPDGRRNKRSVWTVATAPYPEAHFATYPPDLIKPCIMAGTSARGCCSKCGAPWERIVESSKSFESGSGRAGNMPNGKQDLRASETNSTPDIRLGPVVTTKTLGWQATCECGEEPTIPCTVLDCFAGSGTTGEVALELGRSAILIELNPKYAELIDRRCDVTIGLPF